jgi:hypothetical protein
LKFFDWCKTQNEKTFADKQAKKKEEYYGKDYIRYDNIFIFIDFYKL